MTSQQLTLIPRRPLPFPLARISTDKMALRYSLAAMEKHKPYVVMLIIQFIYTGMALFSKAAIAEGMKPPVFVAYRQALATLALAPFAFSFER